MTSRARWHYPVAGLAVLVGLLVAALFVSESNVSHTGLLSEANSAQNRELGDLAQEIGGGPEKGEGEGKVEEEGEEKFSEADFEVACMMLGSVACVMLMIWLVTWQDEDIRRYSWKIISTTISIFLAVLMFQGNNQMLLLVIEHWPPFWVSMAQYVHSLAYIVGLQATMAFISGVTWVSQPPAHELHHKEWMVNDGLSIDNGRKVSDVIQDKSYNGEKSVKPFRSAETGARGCLTTGDGREILCELTELKAEVNLVMQCWARLLAHMAGFAAINAGATMQQMAFYKQTPWHAWVPVIINAVSILFVFWCFGKLRSRNAHKATSQTSGHRAALMEEAAFEAENDISSLSVSFLTVQVIRYAITNVLPDEEGLEEGEDAHESNQILLLYGIGLGFAVLASVFVVIQAQMESGHAHHEDEEGPISVPTRVVMISLNANAMCFAWCTLWATRWLCVKYGVFSITTIIGRVNLAGALTVLAGILVFGLDTVDDNTKGAKGGNRGSAQAIQMLVNALGILVGFSWEHCFDGSVGAMASLWKSPVMRSLLKFLFGLVLFFMITPMWRQHFLTREIIYQRRKDQMENEEEKHMQSAASTPTPSGRAQEENLINRSPVPQR